MSTVPEEGLAQVRASLDAARAAIETLATIGQRLAQADLRVEQEEVCHDE